ncbi:MAG TPA: BON domain-containing protein, partial [Pyrinomonadaceae bacterium]
QKESFQLATTEVFSSALVRYQTPTERYKKNAFQISQKQIALAGYRMGALLDEIFGNKSSQLDKDQYRKDAEASGSKIGDGAYDSQLWFKTRAGLLAVAELRDSTIFVDVIDSKVTLRGTVSNIAQKIKADQVVKNIEGVKAIKNQLKVISK